LDVYHWLLLCHLRAGHQSDTACSFQDCCCSGVSMSGQKAVRPTKEPLQLIRMAELPKTPNQWRLQIASGSDR